MRFNYKQFEKEDGYEKVTVETKDGALIEGYSKDGFQKMQQETAIQIVGATSLKKENNQNKNGEDFNLLSAFGINYIVKESKRKNVFMYISVGDNKYIEYYQAKTPLLLIILLIAAFIIGGLLFSSFQTDDTYKEEPTTIEIEDNSSWDGNLDVNKPKEKIDQVDTTVSGYSKIWVGKDQPNIPLVNDKTNEVYSKYSIQKKDGTVIYETGNIAPGDAHIWKAFDDLSAGEYELNFVISFIDIETFEPCNGATNKVVVTVEK